MSTPNSFRFCPSCGAETLPTEHFCPNCGLKLPLPTSSTAPTPPVPSAPVTPVFQPATPQYQAPQYQPPQYQSPQPPRPLVTAPTYQPVRPQPTPKTRTPAKTILLAMLIIAIVIIGVVASRPFLFPGPSNSNNPSQTPNNNNNNNNSNNNNNGGSSPQTATYQIYTALPYSVLVPKGWHGYGGQTPTGYVVPGIYFYAKDSTGAQSIFFAQSDIPYFIDPSSTDPISGYTVGYLCPQGHWYSPLAQAYSGTGCTSTPSSSPYIVYQALTATEYAQQIQSQPCRYIVSILCAAATQNNPAFSLAVDSVADSPGLLNKMSNWFELTCGPHNNGQSPLTSAASARLSYSVNGVSYQSGVLIEICGFQIGTYKYWYASVSGFTAPASDSAKVVSIYKTIMPTVVLNFDWAKSVVANAGTQESIINGYINQWQQADIQMFQIQNGGNNAAAGWIDALDGVQTGTANGQYYKVPSGYSHAWVDSSGQNLYVSTGTTPPDLSGLIPVNLP